MLDLEFCVPSALLVAITVTVWPPGEMVAGARPCKGRYLICVPTAGLSDHVTAWFAVNCWVCETPSEALPGVSVTGTGGVRVTVVLPSVVPSAMADRQHGDRLRQS